MSSAEIAERYARAIFELGAESGELTELSRQIASFAAVYQGSRELQVAFGDPVVTAAQRSAVLGDLMDRLGLSRLARNTLSLLVDRRRQSVLPELTARLRSLVDEKDGVLRVTVTAADPLSDTYAAKLVGQLEKATGRRIVLEKKHDPDLIAGVVTTIGDHAIDGSLRGKLNEVEQYLQAAS